MVRVVVRVGFTTTAAALEEKSRPGEPSSGEELPVSGRKR